MMVLIRPGSGNIAGRLERLEMARKDRFLEPIRKVMLLFSWIFEDIGILPGGHWGLARAV